MKHRAQSQQLSSLFTSTSTYLDRVEKRQRSGAQQVHRLPEEGGRPNLQVKPRFEEAVSASNHNAEKQLVSEACFSATFPSQT